MPVSVVTCARVRAVARYNVSCCLLPAPTERTAARKGAAFREERRWDARERHCLEEARQWKRKRKAPSQGRKAVPHLRPPPPRSTRPVGSTTVKGRALAKEGSGNTTVKGSVVDVITRKGSVVDVSVTCRPETAAAPTGETHELQHQQRRASLAELQQNHKRPSLCLSLSPLTFEGRWTGCR